MTNRLSAQQISKTLKKFIEKGLFENNTSIIFHDLDFLKDLVEKLISVFPGNTLHAVAAKANPLPWLIKYLKSFGLGCEAATLGEVYLALKSGYAPEKIVFDSPAKTRDELAFALERGVHINADSFPELDRIAELRKNIDSISNIGLRINPQIGTGKISFTSVAGKYSKFGVPLTEFEDKIISYFNKYNWLNGIHVHTGSQGYTIEQLVLPFKKIFSVIDKIQKPLSWIDIGGGLPVNYTKEDNAPSYEDYYNALNKACPELFNRKYRIITEFGRSIHVNAGWTASRVEYVKQYKNSITAVIHVGADLFMRKIYQPEHWHHDISLMDKYGNLKSGSLQKVIIAGPLCFNGDIIARDIELSEIEEGDFIILHDSGGYTLSMWSRHTSRLIPMIMGYTGNGANFQLIKEKESLEDLYNFWS